jgi:hypothetical protein
MKKLIIVAIVAMFSTTALHATEVPEVVKKAFQQKFPTAKKVKWEKEKNNDFEASFILNDKEISAVYSIDGQLKETETEIAVSELPKSVIDALAKKDANAKIEEAEKIERSDNTIIYETEVKINKKKTELLFDSNGNEIK